MSRTLQAAVLADSDALPEACALAAQVGAMLADLGITLITGGGRGATEAACRAAVEAGGLTVGIVPSDRLDDANAWCRSVVATGMGHARNTLVILSADFAIAMGRSAGVLSEVCFAWIHGRPILVMEGLCGRWEGVAAGGIDDRDTSRIVRCRDLSELRRHVSTLMLTRAHN